MTNDATGQKFLITFRQNFPSPDFLISLIKGEFICLYSPGHEALC